MTLKSQNSILKPPKASHWLNSRLLFRADGLSWAVIDQGILSGFNFISGIIYARILGLEGYGVFALLYAVLLYANTVQASIVFSPMMTLAPQMDTNARERFLGGLLGIQVALSSGLAIVLFLGILGLSLLSGWVHPDVALPFGVAIWCFQLQDWVRRYYFTTQQSRRVLISDLISFSILFSTLFVLARRGPVGVAEIFWLISLSTGVAFLFSAVLERLAIRRDAMRETFSQIWESGRDLFLASQLQWGGSQGVLMLAAALLGPQAIGGIRAVLNLLGPFNIIMGLMENLVPVRAARAFASGGTLGLKSFLDRVTVVGGVCLSIPCIVLALFSRDAMTICYGETFAPYAHLIWFGLAFFVLSFVFRQQSYLFRTIGATPYLRSASLISAITSVFFVILSIGVLKEKSVFVAAIISQTIGIGYLASRATSELGRA